MLFPDASPSREQVYDELADALGSAKTRIYVDASLLIHSYEISLSARDELLDVLDAFGDRVAVPLWAAQETWQFMRGRISRRPLEAPAQRLRLELERFRGEALRYVDDDTVSDLTKDGYQAQLDAANEAYGQMMDMVSNYQPKTDVTTSKVAPFLESRRLQSDLSTILDRISRVGALRAAHGIPPGFADVSQTSGEEGEEPAPPAAKGRGKLKNAYGDLIFWFEALADCKARAAEHLIIITRDVTKGDWVYTPDKVRDEQGRVQENSALTLPAPLLVSEAHSECPELKQLHVVSLEMFAYVIQARMRLNAPNLAAALQAGADRKRRKGSSKAQDRLERPGASQVGPSAPTQNEAVTFDGSDLAYDFTDGDPIDELLADLAVETWSAQNDAAQALETLLPTASRAQLIQIGRSLVAASNGGAIGPLELLDRTFSQTNANYRSMMMVGVLAGIYIAEDGELKKPEASARLAEIVFGLEGQPDLEAAYDAVIGRLAAQRRGYLALPTDHPDSIPLLIELEGDRLLSVTASGVAILEQGAPASRVLRRSTLDPVATVGELVIEIAQEFAVPPRLLVSNILLSNRITIPENLGFVGWGPNTGLLLR